MYVARLRNGAGLAVSPWQDLPILNEAKFVALVESKV
jgi:hypothetical protein